MNAPAHRLGIVTGLIAEAACIPPPPKDADPRLVFCSGGSPARAREGARRLVADGANALLSFGVAGGLDPDLPSGTVVLADSVALPDGRALATDAAWRKRLRELIPPDLPTAVAPVMGSDRPVLDPAAKHALFAASAAAAVDMESHIVADVAHAAGLPFLALRAVADPAARRVPGAALAGLAPEGRTRPWAVLGAVLRRPWEGPALVRVAAESARALAALRRVARLGPPLLGLV